MKQFITFIVAAFAATTQAASFQWRATGVSFGGKALENTTGYLVYLDSSTSVSDLFTIDYTAPGSITIASTVDEAKTGSGRNAGTLLKTYNDSTSTGGDGSQVAIGKNFGMILLYNDGTDTWYNFTTAAQSITADATGAFERKTFAFDYSTQTTITSDGQTPSGWTKINIAAVPEPSTAALALAGLALLLKRRKA